MTERLIRLINWLKDNDYDGWQVFYCRNTVGDKMCTMYTEDDITVDVCSGWGYLEIFGLTKEEQESLCKECARLTLKDL